MSKFASNSESLAEIYLRDGIVHIPNFLSCWDRQHILDELSHCERVANQELESQWGGKKLTFYSKNPVKSDAGKDCENYVVNPYFQVSKDRCHVFFEEINDQVVLNRMGHGLHLQPSVKHINRLVYENATLHSVLKDIGYRRPICLLSVYIPKYPNGFGSEVRPHQESAFAHTEPLSACVLWIALEDATIKNACMYGLPESHKFPLKFVSKVDHVRGERNYVKLNEVDMPEFDPAGSIYTPLEVAAGEALLFHGNYVHCSPQNTSDRSRKALSFQFVETDGAEFSSFNWIVGPNQAPLYVL